MRQAYSSDITMEQFAEIKTTLESAAKKTRPRKTDLYEIYCAILYLCKTGCSWRLLPHDFPKWQLVYYYFTEWSRKDKDGQSILEKVLRKLVESERMDTGREPETSMIIVDSRSVKNANTAEEKGYDGGKKNIGN
jgi:transposase